MKSMLSTNFNDKMLPELNELLDFVQKNTYSSFYCQKYGKIIEKIATYEDFQKIPFLTKDEFRELSVSDITFVPESEVIRYGFSSGTTAAPTILPRMKNANKNTQHKDFNDRGQLTALGVKNILTLTIPTGSMLTRLIRNPEKNLRLIHGDIHNLPMAAHMAKEVGVQGIITTPSRLLLFLPILKKTDFNLNSIKWVNIGSEFCSAHMLEKFKREMPAAIFLLRFGASEIGTRRVNRCEYLENNPDPSLFHPVPLTEIIDEQQNVLPLRKYGELVHSDLEKKAFPLLRYRTGDVGTLIASNCPCGHPLLLIVEGRKGMDFASVGKYIFSARTIASAMQKSTTALEPQFQLHVFSNPITKLELWIQLCEENKNAENENFKTTLAKEISSCLPIKDQETLSELTAKKELPNLEIVFIDQWQLPEKKMQHIVIHD